MKFNLQSRPFKEVQNLFRMLRLVLILQVEGVENDDFVVITWKIRVCIRPISVEITLVDGFPAFQPFRREPEDLILSPLAYVLPFIKAGQYIVAVLSLNPDDLLVNGIQDCVHTFEGFIRVDIAFFSVNDDPFLVRSPFLGLF